MAKIATRGMQVTDCFYVTRSDGEKLRDPQRIGRLHDALLAALDEADEPATDSPDDLVTVPAY